MVVNILACVFALTTVLSLVAWYLEYRSSSTARKGMKELYEGTTKMQSLVDDAMDQTRQYALKVPSHRKVC